MKRMSNHFRQLALSFYGSDGGNLDSEIWFCGLEWGGSLDWKSDTTEKVIDPIGEESGYLVTSSTKHDYRQNISWSHGFSDAVKNGVNQKICWFLNYYYNLEPVDTYRYDQFVVAHEICFNRPKGKGFKMNLFPLNAVSHDVDWCDDCTQFTGFNNRSSYEIWCMIHHGIYYQTLLKRHQPKIVLCLGKSHAAKYYRFWDAELVDKTERNLGDVTIEFCQIPETESYLIVVPFFGGTYGINSGEKMRDLVELVHNILGTTMPYKRTTR